MNPLSMTAFHDLGYDNPEEAAIKSILANKIRHIIEQRKLKQTEAAEIVKLDQPKVSKIINGKLRGFSISLLIQCLVALGYDVLITVEPKDNPELRIGIYE